MERIAAFHYFPSGCFWYRTKQPMDLLQKNGVDVEWVRVDKDILNFHEIKSFHIYGAVPFSLTRALEFIKKEGAKIVYDADDALDLIEETNPFYYSVRKDLGSANEMLAYADEITTTNESMVEYLKGKTDKPITIIPNSYTESDWNFERPKREGIRIGFAGSATHVEDLIDIIPVIKNLQAKYDITFIIMGFGKQNYPDWFNSFRYLAPPEAQRKLIELDKQLSTIHFEWVDYVDYTLYPQTLINMALDIGLCPLKDTPFNRCRSACKAMEYTLAGAVAIASNVITYQREPTSLLVNAGEWEDAIELLIKHPDVRESFHKAHLLWIKANRNIDKQLEPLKRIYGIV